PSDPGLQRAARLPFPREWLDESLWPARRSTRLSGRNFCSLIVQQMKGSLAERFKMHSVRFNCKTSLHLIVQPEEKHPGPLNDLNANDTLVPAFCRGSEPDS